MAGAACCKIKSGVIQLNQVKRERAAGVHTTLQECAAVGTATAAFFMPKGENNG